MMSTPTAPSPQLIIELIASEQVLSHLTCQLVATLDWSEWSSGIDELVMSSQSKVTLKKKNK